MPSLPHAARAIPGRIQILSLALLLAASSAVASRPAIAQEAVEESRLQPGDAPEEHTGSARRSDRRLYVGMVTLHFRELDRGLDNNSIIGVSLGRFYGATLINSFGKRAYTAGVQGAFTQRATGPVTLGFGYRAGLITGYDERFISLAGKTPVLPLLQPLATVDAKRVGMELSYAGVVASAALNVRF
jgi:hypothetical protein